MAHCIGSQLLHEPLPVSPLWARGWMDFGHPAKPQPGAVMVFWREEKNGSKGHVGFYVGEEEDSDAAYHILGGNQSDSVCVTRVSKSRLLGARWPATVPAPRGRPNFVTDKRGELSHNEA